MELFQVRDVTKSGTSGSPRCGFVKAMISSSAPGSQQKKNPYEADSNFGRVVEGVENGVIAKIHSVPQMGWLSEENCVKITKLTILANSVSQPDVWTEWKMTNL